MKNHHIVAILLLAVLALAIVTGCATDPRTGRQTLDYAATARLLGAIGTAIAPQPTPHPDAQPRYYSESSGSGLTE